MDKNGNNIKKVKPLPVLTKKHTKPSFVPKTYTKDKVYRTELSQKHKDSTEKN